MPCIDVRGRARLRVALTGLALLGACSSPMPPSTPAPAPVPRPALPASPAPGAAATRLPSPAVARSWDELRQQAARRLVAANPDGTYMGIVPDVLLAIPVLEIELNADGSVRRVDVLRVPRQAKDTVQLATAAVYRAAPFGDVSRLPKPWRFAETFLFNDDRKFKPRTLD